MKDDQMDFIYEVGIQQLDKSLICNYNKETQVEMEPPENVLAWQHSLYLQLQMPTIVYNMVGPRFIDWKLSSSDNIQAVLRDISVLLPTSEVLGAKYHASTISTISIICFVYLFVSKTLKSL